MFRNQPNVDATESLALTRQVRTVTALVVELYQSQLAVVVHTPGVEEEVENCRVAAFPLGAAEMEEEVAEEEVAGAVVQNLVGVALSSHRPIQNSYIHVHLLMQMLLGRHNPWQPLVIYHVPIQDRSHRHG